MKKTIFALLLPALLGLVSCGNDGERPSSSLPESAGNSSLSSSLSSSPASSEKESSASVPVAEIPTYEGVSGTPAPLILPQRAPKDYEGFTPYDVAEDAFTAYTFIDHALANTNYYALTYGKSTTTGTINYTQNIASLKAFVGTTGMSRVVALAQGTVGGIGVNTAEERFEDVDNGYYGYRNGDGKTASIDADSHIPEVSSFENWSDDVFSRPTFLQVFGHDIFGFTNYYVPSSSYLSGGLVSSEGTDSFNFSFDFSISESHNAGLYYLVEQQHMISGSGVGGNVVSLSLKSLHVEVTVGGDFLPKTMSVVETYDGSVAGLSLITLTTDMTTTFHPFEGETIPDAEVDAIFQGAKDAFLEGRA